MDQFTKKQPLIYSSNIKAPEGALIYSSCKQKKKQGRSNLLCFNQPTKRHLISMLMRLARSLLVQRHLYAVWLERNNNTVPIRGRCNLQSPCSTYRLLQIALALPNLISYRIGGDTGGHQRDTCARAQTHTQTSHIIRSAIEAQWLLLR